MPSRLRIAALLALLVALVPATGAHGQAAPVLGAADYVTNGAGFGTVAPETISNGGAPSGVVDDIRWTGWGEPTALGEGDHPTYRPQGGYYPRPARIRLRVDGLASCPGSDAPAYTQLSIRVPNWPGGPRGPWLKWSGTQDMCGYDTEDPDYEYPTRPPGICASIDGFDDEYTPGGVFSLQAYGLSCTRAERAAAQIGARRWPQRCIRQGCTPAVRGLRCRLHRVLSTETTIGIDVAYPVQRVSCRQGSATLSGFLVLSFD